MSDLPPLADDPLRRAIRALATADERAQVTALLAEADAALGGGHAIVTEATALVDALRAASCDWRDLDARERLQPGRRLQRLIAHDPHREHDARATLALAVQHLLDAAAATLAPRRLAGATDETCTLYCEARGVLLLAARAGASERDLLLPALAALLAGNAVLLLTDQASSAQAMGVRNLRAGAGFTDALSAHHAYAQPQDIAAVVATCAIDGVACHRDPALAQRLDRALAVRGGALLPLIDEHCGPHYALRFVHEKAVAMDDTAAGGNAALLAQAESG